MGRVIVPIKATNFQDRAGQRVVESGVEARSIEVDALVDSGATLLCLKRSLIDRLQLTLLDSVPMHTANGIRNVGKFGPVWLEVGGRACLCSALELNEETPNLLGQIPLEELDFVIDSKNQRLIANPAHGGVQSAEVYASRTPETFGNP